MRRWRLLMAALASFAMSSPVFANAPVFSITSPSDGESISTFISTETITFSGTASSSPAVLHQAWGVQDSTGTIVAEGIFTGSSFSEMITLDASQSGSDYTLIVGGVNDDTFDVEQISITITHDSFLEDAIGVWLFDEGSGGTTEDESSSGVDGTLCCGPNGASWVSDGMFGPAIEFDGGADCVSMGQPLLDDVTEFTITAWVRSEVMGGNRRGIVGQNDTIEFGLIASTTLQLWSEGAGGAADANWPYNNDGEWHHVIAWGTTSELRVYIDGTLEDSTSISTSDHGSSGEDVNIGGCGIFDGSGNFFIGAIDDIGVFTRALEDDEMDAIRMYGLAATLGVAFLPNATTTWLAMKVQRTE